MKTIVTFLSVIVLVSSGKLISGATHTMKISNLKERTHIFNPTATPPANVQINDLPEEHVPHITDQGYIGFCNDCAWTCFGRNKKMARCDNFICRCTKSGIN
ncbi:hypothetical protein Bca52824_069066 [Brassica carinata]|uniref:Uncharacterized protein n=1 Tax=Brassica carinata TaxID=52824 RepID=A0A8X7Q3F5_BRACI|nr:hypothetical protein Bca52824_069066 [Brassica carinata]